METVIQTPRSELLKWKFEDTELLKQCCEEVKSKLIEKPEIRVYGDVTFVMPTLARDSSFIIFKDVGSYGSRFSYCIEKLSSMFKLSY